MATTCSLPTTGGTTGIILALVFLAVGIGLVLLVRRSPAKLSFVAALPLLAAAGVAMAPPATDCQPAPTTPTTIAPIGDETSTTAADTSAPSTLPPGEVPTTERYSDDLVESSTIPGESTLPPAPTVTTTWPSSPTTAAPVTTAAPSTVPGTPPPISTTTTTTSPPPTTLRPAPTTTVRPPMTWAPYGPGTTERELEYTP